MIHSCKEKIFGERLDLGRLCLVTIGVREGSMTVERSDSALN